jgi:hypothetical protein
MTDEQLIEKLMKNIEVANTMGEEISPEIIQEITTITYELRERGYTTGMVKGSTLKRLKEGSNV